MTWGAFATRLLEAIKAPRTLHNRRLMVTWFQSEGSNAKWNPLDCVVKMPGSTDFNWNGGIPVQNYPDAETGIKAIVKTIEGRGHHYQPILAALRRNATAPETIKTIGASDWGTSEKLMRAVLRDARRALPRFESKIIAH